MNVLPDGYGWLILGGLLCILAVMVFKSPTMQSQIKKGFILLLIVLGVSFGYYLITGKSPTEIPSEISFFFNKHREPESTSHRYYVNPEERIKDVKD